MKRRLNILLLILLLFPYALSFEPALELMAEEIQVLDQGDETSTEELVNDSSENLEDETAIEETNTKAVFSNDTEENEKNVSIESNEEIVVESNEETVVESNEEAVVESNEDTNVESENKEIVVQNNVVEKENKSALEKKLEKKARADSTCGSIISWSSDNVLDPGEEAQITGELSVNPDPDADGLEVGDRWTTLTITLSDNLIPNDPLSFNSSTILSPNTLAESYDPSTNTLTFAIKDYYESGIAVVEQMSLYTQFINAVDGEIGTISFEVSSLNGMNCSSDIEIEFNDPNTWNIKKERVSPSNNYISLNDEITYEITVDAEGTSEVTEVIEIVDNLPDGVSIIDASGAIVDGSMVTWELTEEEKANKSASRLITISIDDEVYNVGDELINNAQVVVDSNIEDEVNASDEISEGLIILPNDIQKTAHPGETGSSAGVRPGDSINWTFDNIDVDGVGTLNNYRVVDVMPEDIFTVSQINFGSYQEPNSLKKVVIEYTGDSGKDPLEITDIIPNGSYALSESEGQDVATITYYYGDIELPFNIEKNGQPSVDTIIRNDIDSVIDPDTGEPIASVENRVHFEFDVDISQGDGDESTYSCPPPYEVQVDDNPTDNIVSCGSDGGDTIEITEVPVVGGIEKTYTDQSPYHMGDEIKYKTSVTNNAISTEPIEVEMLTDFLNEGEVLNPDSIVVKQAGTEITNYTLVNDDESMFKIIFDDLVDVQPGTNLTFEYSTTITTNESGKHVNRAYVNIANEIVSNGVGQITNDVDDLNNDGNTSDAIIFDKTPNIKVNPITVEVSKNIEGLNRDFLPETVVDNDGNPISGKNIVPYEITIKNENESGTITNPQIHDILPNILTVLPDSFVIDTDLEYSKANITGSDNDNNSIQEFTIDFTGDFEPGDEIIISFDAHVNDYAQFGKFTNTVELIPTNKEEIYSEDSIFKDSVAASITGIAGQKLTKITNKNYTAAGESVRYDIGVFNSGTYNLSKIKFDDIVPRSDDDRYDPDPTTVASGLADTYLISLPIIKIDGERVEDVDYIVHYLDSEGIEQVETVDNERLQEIQIAYGYDAVIELEIDFKDFVLNPGALLDIIYEVEVSETAKLDYEFYNNASVESGVMNESNSEIRRISSTSNTVQTIIEEAAEGTYTIGDFVYFDYDNDNEYSEGDRPAEAIRVELYRDGNFDGIYDEDTATLEAYSLTNNDGIYRFPNLSEGDYHVDVYSSILEGMYHIVPDQGYDFSTKDLTIFPTADDGTKGPYYNYDFDFALQPGVISGNVFYDANYNTIHEGGEVSITNETPGVTDEELEIELQVLETGTYTTYETTTTQNGYYEFDNLPAGDYRVVINYDASTRKDYIYTTKTQIDVPIEIGELSEDNDFGLIEPAEVNGTIWNDFDMEQDFDELGVKDVKVRVVNESDSSLNKQMLTNSDGEYDFTYLLPGEYHVEYTALPEMGYVNNGDSKFINGLADVVTLAPKSSTTLNGGLFDYAYISGNFYEDMNNNKVKDVSDENLSNYSIELLDEDGTVVQTKKTNSAGNYLFTSVIPRENYTVRFNKNKDEEFILGTETADTTIDENGQINLDASTIIPGETNNENNASIVVPFNVRGTTFEDMNGDDLYNDSTYTNDEILSNITVELLNESKDVIATTKTDEQGKYQFEHLYPGTYQVRVTRPTSYISSTMDSGNDAIDSDVNEEDGTSDIKVLLSHADDTVIDAGYYKYADINGIVYEDLNVDYYYDSGDVLLENIDVTLYRNGIEEKAVKTDANGHYEFTELKPGDYSVHTDEIAEYNIYYPSSRGEVGVAGANDIDHDGNTLENLILSDETNGVDYDAAYIIPASISGTVFYEEHPTVDLLASYDEGTDIPLGNVMLDLYDLKTNKKVATTYSDANGYYKFENLEPGNYQVVSHALPSLEQLTVVGAIASNGKSDVISPEYGENITDIDNGLFADQLLVGDFVFEDKNMNGIQDEGEDGIAGVTIKLFDDADNELQSVTTDATGHYQVVLEEPGYYYLKAEIPNGYLVSNAKVGTDDTKDSDFDPTTLETPEEWIEDFNNNIDLGLQDLSTISGHVYRDLDQSGSKSLGDDLSTNAEVKLVNKANREEIITTTDVNGYYEFTDLIPGDYIVEFGAPQKGNWTEESDGKLNISELQNTANREIEVPYNKDIENENAGFENNSLISGYVYEDMNANGVYQLLSGDNYLEGINANLYEEGVDTPIATTATGANGYYEFVFEHNNTRNYYVQFDLESPYTNVSEKGISNVAKDNDTNSDGKTDISAIEDGGTNEVSYDAALYKPVEISGIAYEDHDYNSTLSSGDINLANVQVELYKDDLKLATTMTDKDGKYQFSNLAPGEYYVSFIVPSEYNVSPKGIKNTSGDNDADEFGKTDSIVFESGEANDVSYDLAVFKTATISGTIFYETRPIDNNKAIYDSSIDKPESDVTVELLDNDNKVIDSTNTDETGYYEFSNLIPGTYQVRSSDIEDTHYLNVDNGIKNTQVSSLITVAYDETMSNVDGGVFADYLKIGDKVFNDRNKNGIQDTDEEGIANVKVDLYSNNNVLEQSTITDSNGNYEFIVDRVDLYNIKVEIPYGYEAAPKNVGSDTTIDSDINTDGITNATEYYEDTLDLDAGLVELGSVSGTIYRDIDRSGNLNEEDSRFSGHNVTLTNIDTTESKSMYTNENGDFYFDEVPSGNYEITYDEAPKGTWIEATDPNLEIDTENNTATRRIKLGINEDLKDQNAGFIVNTNISGIVYENMHADGYYETALDERLEGITVELYENENPNAIAKTKTNKDGEFEFDIENVGTNNYFTKVMLPDGYIGYSDNLANGVRFDNDTNSNGMTNAVAVEEGSMNYVDFDTAIYREVAISGYVYEDKDYNSDYTAKDEWLAEVTVNLYKDDEFIMNTVTNSEGYFEFSNLKPGTYHTEFVKPNNYYYSPIGASDISLINDADSTGTTSEHSYKSNESDDVNFDAALYQTVSLNGYVYNDMNINGQKDKEDLTIVNREVTLYENGNKVAMTTTNNDGYYEFTNLIPANYKVEINTNEQQIAKLGNQSTKYDNDLLQNGTTNSHFIYSNETNELDYDGALYDFASLGGVVYEDFNANGIRESEDEAIANVTINLLQSDEIVASTITDDEGKYQFTNVIPGDYIVELPNNSLNVSPITNVNTAEDNDLFVNNKTSEMNISSGEENFVDFDAGLYDYASISGIVYEDQNADSKYSEIDNGLANISVTLYNGDDEAVATTVTNEAGQYQFANLIPNNYYVMINTAGMQISNLGNENEKGDNDLLKTGKTRSQQLVSKEVNEVDYDGALYNFAKLSGYVYEDYATDSTYNEEQDRMLADETMYLFKDGLYVTETTSNSEGYYEFTDLIPGNYQTFYQQEKWAITELGSANTAFDNDLNQDGFTHKVFLTSNTYNSVSFDAGLFDQSRLGGYIYEDKNINGKKDSDEPGIADITVNLYNDEGFVKSIQTLNSGFYAFLSLDPDNYYIEVEVPENYYISGLGMENVAGDNDLKQDGTSDSHFLVSEQTNLIDYDGALYTTTEISGYVYNDLNANGIKDGKDLELPNLKMNLLKDGSQIASTKTNRFGYYEFTELLPGNYEVEVELGDRRVSIKGQENTAFDNDFNSNGISNSHFVLSSTPNKVDYDAALYNSGTITGIIYEDMNIDGDKGLFEPALEGINVSLYNDRDELIEKTVSNKNGHYEFTGLDPDNYYVTIDSAGMQIAPLGEEGVAKQNDLDASGRTATHQLVSGYENGVDYDAGLYNYAALSGYVYEDRDNNGTLNDVDQEIVSHKVYLYKENEVIAETKTDESGYYEFTKLKPGQYHIELASFEDSDQNSIYNSAMRGKQNMMYDNDLNEDFKTDEITLTSGEVENKSNDAGIYIGINLSGYVYEDMNSDGRRAQNDQAIENITVNLYNVETGLTQTITTDSIGYYEFVNLVPGTYYVEVETKDYLISEKTFEETKFDNDLTQDSTTMSHTYLSGENDDVNYDAALYQTGIIAGVIYEDYNINGSYESDDVKLENIQIDLYDDNENVIASTTTDKNGYYEFTEINPGSYYTMAVLEKNQKYYVSNLGSANTALANDLMKNSKTPFVTIKSGQNNKVDFDGALYRNASLSGTVYEDIDADGELEEYDNLLEDYQVDLYKTNVLSTRSNRYTKVATAKTNENGVYEFTELTPGYYRVYIAPKDYVIAPMGLRNTAGSNDINKQGYTEEFFLASGTSDNRDADAGLFSYATISGYLYEDLINNGEFEYNDIGLANQTVSLYRGKELIDSTRTDDNGYYEFTNLIPDTYRTEYESNEYESSILGTENTAYANDATKHEAIAKTKDIKISSAEINDLDFDYGLYKTISLGGYVYNDHDIDGNFNNSDQMLKNIEVTLIDQDNSRYETVTNEDGFFEFTNLNPGVYNTSTNIGTYSVTPIIITNTELTNDSDENGLSTSHQYYSGEIDYVNYDTALYTSTDLENKNKEEEIDGDDSNQTESNDDNIEQEISVDDSIQEKANEEQSNIKENNVEDEKLKEIDKEQLKETAKTYSIYAIIISSLTLISLVIIRRYI